VFASLVLLKLNGLNNKVLGILDSSLVVISFIREFQLKGEISLSLVIILLLPNFTGFNSDLIALISSKQIAKDCFLGQAG
jgi:hypothetical protein